MTSERYIPEHRRTQFKAKNTFKPDELRRRREEQQVEIRKQKREENLAKRRGISGKDGLTAPGASLGASIDSDDDGGTIESQVCYIMSLYSLKTISVWMQGSSLPCLTVFSCCIPLLRAAQSAPQYLSCPWINCSMHLSSIHSNTVKGFEADRNP